jgi:hypothetical protein
MGLEEAVQEKPFLTGSDVFIAPFGAQFIWPSRNAGPPFPSVVYLYRTNSTERTQPNELNRTNSTERTQPNKLNRTNSTAAHQTDFGTPNLKDRAIHRSGASPIGRFTDRGVTVLIAPHYVR